ncbi:signal recognition particle protein [Buchnera aphidicola (Nipponaphis monzeni)]|uniref:signal-recognition-particle GTPase n=1 Tax=Buchnera aphidicola (Nipponaphis monzeni) TaxID=2495405 RepID=A0A455TAD5_9GAMM|nr:signal recognition particle protein [Buchnera aphidicola]BBI01311.1 signal recognition particle protein [Buchnera aphidicola (Nipponaphis monzeni)]
MFNLLKKRFSEILEKISNKGIITEKNIKVTLREIRKSLLEADVALSVVKKFIHNVKKKSLGKKFNTSLTPGQEFIKIIKHELIQKLGNDDNTLKFSKKPPSIYLIVGLQGMGKTTSIGKIGQLLHKQYKKKVLNVTTDTYRFAAVKQLELLSLQTQIDFFLFKENNDPKEIAINSIKYAIKKSYDVVLIDTSGRLHTDQKMMLELQDIYKTINPTETLLVVDSMLGQDVTNIAERFSTLVNITGIILTKMDSDTKGGVALSIKELTQKPIKFVGNGEKLDAIEIFNSQKIANRILGMEDIFSLIKEIENKIILPKQKINNLKKKFDLNDFLIYVNQVRNTGGLAYLIKKLPINKTISQLSNTINDKELNNFVAIINSMTKIEKKNPNIIKNSRKHRIALGSGLNVQSVNKLLKQFDIVKKMVEKVKKIGLSQSIKNLFF